MSIQTIKDPRTIPQSVMPQFIDCNQAYSPVSDITDLRTDEDGVPPESHSMLSIDQGEFVCQSPGGYNEIPMKTYMTPGTTLRFMQLVNSNTAFAEAFRASVLAKLNGPWYRKCYNWLQFFGQAVGLPWISFPGLDDCSMDVIYHLKVAAPNLPQADNEIIQGIPNTCNPEQWTAIQLNNPNVFNVWGFYTYGS